MSVAQTAAAAERSLGTMVQSDSGPAQSAAPMSASTPAATEASSQAYRQVSEQAVAEIGANLQPPPYGRTPADESAGAIPAEVRTLLAQLQADPAAVLMGLQCHLRDRRSADLRQQAAGAAERQDAMQREKMAAMHEAANAAESANSFLGGLPPAVQTALKIFVVVAAAVATVMTAGAAGAALAVAGAVLILAAEPLTNAAVEIGLVEKKDAHWLRLGLELAGSIMMAGAGMAATGATATGNAAQISTTVKNAAEAIKSTAKIVQVCEGVGQGIREGAAAAYLHTANVAQAEAEDRQIDIEDASGDLGETNELLREELRSFARCARRLSAIVQTQGEARMAATRALA